jgi:caffeoyl-CoA O-methyltransferase
MKRTRAWLPGEMDLDWIEAISPPPAPAILAIEAAAEPDGIPILDRHSGRVLAVLAADRRRILEIGTAIGCSTTWMALAQPPDGHIITIDPDRERTSRARAFWREAGIADLRIDVVNEPALDALAAGDQLETTGDHRVPAATAARRRALAGPFDLVFIDALKEEYSAYLEAVRPRLRPGGLLVADNVLWSGRTSGSRPADGRTDALRAFARAVLEDDRFVGTILPVGDGLLVATWRP